MKKWLVVAFAASVTAAPAVAEFGDAGTGKALAERWCAECHVVSAAQEATDMTGAPAFKALSERETATQDGLLAVVQGPHPRMPDLDLSRQQAADLAAYIASLKGE